MNFNMITTKRVNEYQADVLADGMPFGVLEKIGAGYNLYFLNELHYFPEAEQKRIIPFCEKLYIRERSFHRRKLIKEHKLRNSILKQDFKILS